MYEIDSFFVKWAQAAHDFVWNNFGITRGLIAALSLLSMSLYAYLIAANSLTLYTVWVLSFLFSLRAIKQHNMQVKGVYKTLNADALFKRESKLFVMFRVILLMQIPIGIVFGIKAEPFILLTWFYAEVCLVQDREIPESRFQYNHGV